MGLPRWYSGKPSACQCQRCGFDPWVGIKDPLDKEMETHSRILAWEIPWTEEPGMLQSMGSKNLKLYLFIYFWWCWVFAALHGLSLDVVNGVTFHCGAWVSHCGGFSCCGVQVQ